jgi:hypothetical protein
MSNAVDPSATAYLVDLDSFDETRLLPKALKEKIAAADLREITQGEAGMLLFMQRVVPVHSAETMTVRPAYGFTVDECFTLIHG